MISPAFNNIDDAQELTGVVPLIPFPEGQWGIKLLDGKTSIPTVKALRFSFADVGRPNLSNQKQPSRRKKTAK